MVKTIDIFYELAASFFRVILDIPVIRIIRIVYFIGNII